MEKQMDMVTMRLQKEIQTVEYNPTLDKYYIPSRSRGSKIAKWEVFQSLMTGRWWCNCENFCIGLDYKGECRHIKLAKFYKNHEWNKRHIVVRERD